MDRKCIRISEKVADFVRDADTDHPSERFNSLALEVFEYQYRSIKPYRRLCQYKDKTPETVQSWSEIPAVPADAFKQFTLFAGQPDQIAKTFRSSGTTDSRNSSKSHFSAAGLELMNTAVGVNAARMLFPDNRRTRILALAPGPEIAPHMIMVHGMSHMIGQFGAEGSRFCIGAHGLDVKSLQDELRQCYEGTPVHAVERLDGVTRIDLGIYGETKCKIFVNCSGRTGNTTITGERSFLSNYRNIAIWNHIVGGKKAQTLPGDWNIFREKDLSPVGSLAFEDGWFWYIPVPKLIQGKRVVTHSLGVVTDPSALKDPAKRFTDPKIFMETARKVPLLGELIQEAELVSDKFLTAPNYSRISGRMCDWHKREIRVGDAAYFVDPLFSSGVHFALQHAGMAVTMIKAAFDDTLSDALKEELWEDYHEQLCSVSRGFAAGIDQWYTEISRDNPNSVYWKHRGSQSTFDTRAETFQALVNSQIHGDLIQVITKGTNSVNSLGKEGALRRTHDEIQHKEPPADVKVRLKPNVAVKQSMTLEGPIQTPDGKVISFLHGPYWDDPEKHAQEVLPLCGDPRPCHRFYFTDGEGEVKVKFIDADHKGLELYDLLRSSAHTYGQLKEKLSGPQQHLLLLTALSDMVEAAPGAAASAD